MFLVCFSSWLSCLSRAEVTIDVAAPSQDKEFARRMLGGQTSDNVGNYGSAMETRNLDWVYDRELHMFRFPADARRRAGGDHMYYEADEHPTYGSGFEGDNMYYK